MITVCTIFCLFFISVIFHLQKISIISLFKRFNNFWLQDCLGKDIVPFVSITDGCILTLYMYLYTVDSFIFVGYQFSWILWVQVNKELCIFFLFCMQRLAKSRNQISMKMQLFINPRQLISKKINESTVILEMNSKIAE